MASEKLAISLEDVQGLFTDRDGLRKLVEESVWNSQKKWDLIMFDGDLRALLYFFVIIPFVVWMNRGFDRWLEKHKQPEYRVL
jgi:hypothetical protein